MEIGLEGAIGLAKLARANGAQTVSLCSTSWNLAGDCEKPAGCVATGSNPRGTASDWNAGKRYTARWEGDKVITASRPPPHTVHLQVRCRGCASCRRYRRRLWAARARQETRLAARTWFCTLTASPQAQFMYWMRACKELRRNGLEPERLTEAEQFSERCGIMGKELQKFVKRVRAETGAPLRALWVFESHASGLPHVHGLLHESSEVEPVRWALLNRQWTDGHSVFKLLTNDRESAYVTKYLSKDALCRIRASVKYGRWRHSIP